MYLINDVSHERDALDSPTFCKKKKENKNIILVLYVIIRPDVICKLLFYEIVMNTIFI